MAKKKWKESLREISEDAPQDKIEVAAKTLESKTYEPILLLKTPKFLRMKRADLEKEIARVRAMSDKEMMAEGFAADADFDSFKAKHLQLLIYHYKLLCRLRNDDAEAWDTINELYEDD